jgi:hypothetical protein
MSLEPLIVWSYGHDQAVPTVASSFKKLSMSFTCLQQEYSMIMDLLKEPLYAIFSMPFINTIVRVTSCNYHQESDDVQTRCTNSSARDHAGC